MKFFKRIHAYFRAERARHQKLKQLFKQGHIVQNLRSGLTYEVLEVDLNFVWLANDSTGASFVLDLMTPAGTLRTEIADEWNLTPDESLRS